MMSTQQPVANTSTSWSWYRLEQRKRRSQPMGELQAGSTNLMAASLGQGNQIDIGSGLMSRMYGSRLEMPCARQSKLLVALGRLSGPC